MPAAYVGRPLRKVNADHEGVRTMATMTDRIKGFLNSARGRAMMQRGRRAAAKPSTQQKFKQMASRITGRTAPRR